MATIDAARAAALSLPEAEEHDHFGRPSFRVRGKIFATVRPDEGRAVLKLPPGEQTALFDHPEIYSAARWGKLVWTFVVLDLVDDRELAGRLRSAWSVVAPKALLKRLELP
jgi:hypothetical protein